MGFYIPQSIAQSRWALKYKDELSEELHMFMDTLQIVKIDHLEYVQSCSNKGWDETSFKIHL